MIFFPTTCGLGPFTPLVAYRDCDSGETIYTVCGQDSATEDAALQHASAWAKSLNAAAQKQLDAIKF